MSPETMQRAVSGLSTKSAKIRALSDAGVRRADIARFLGVRYQHVRNVLIAYESQKKATGTSDVSALRAKGLSVGRNGTIILPAEFLTALGVAEGDGLIATISNDAIELMTGREAARRAQDMLAPFLDDKANLVDDLLADRRREVQQENDGG